MALALAAQGQVKIGANVKVGGGSGTTYTAGKGIDVTTTVISATNAFAQTSVAAGDVLTANGNFATTYTIPANTLTAGSVVEVWSAGTLATGGAGASRFRVGVKFGSTTVVPSGGGFIGNSASVGWNLQARIICISTGAGGTVEAQGMNHQADALGNVYTGGLFQTAVVTVDTTATQAVTIFLTDNITSAGNSMTMRQLIVKIAK